MIHGVTVTPLKQIFDERGKVMHMLREDSPNFSRFGEIYFSCVRSGSIKAWHLHTKMTLNYTVVFGEINFVLFDDRPDSPTCGEVNNFIISPENYILVTVPPSIWNGFQGISLHESIVANCSTLPHFPEEMRKKSPNDPFIQYNWQ